VVVLALMAHGQDGDCGGVLDLEDGDMARMPKRDHQFPQERTLPRLAAREW